MFALGCILGGSAPARTAALQGGALQAVSQCLLSDIFEVQREAVFALRHALQDSECLELLGADVLGASAVQAKPGRALEALQQLRHD